jgi:hypothetical protein
MKFLDIQGRLTESEVVLTESSKFTKLRQYIYGLKSHGDGIAIVTPMNPMGGEEAAKEYDSMTPAEQQKHREQNNDSFAEGEEYIKKTLKKRYIKQAGVFGMKERSFIIIDMSAKETAALGRKWKQTSAIHIGIEPNVKKGMSKLAFKMINTTVSAAGPVVESLVRSLFSAPKDRDDYYSIVSGNKYVIPFYDSEAEWKAVYGPDAEPSEKDAANQPVYRKDDGTFVLPKKAA